MHTSRNAAWRLMLLTAWFFCALSSAQQQPPARFPQPSAEQIERRQITLNCAEEGRLSLRIATAYFGVSGRSRDETLAYAKQQGEKGEALAGDLFSQAGAGVISGAPRYATQRVIRCLENNNYPLGREVTVEMSDLCWARSDAIHLSMAQKQSGRSREEAEAALRARFSNPVAFPPAYLREVNGVVYERIAGPLEANSAQVTLYLGCLVAQVRASRE